MTGTADGEWHAELEQGTTYLARNLAVAAAAVSRAAKELHDDLATPIDEIIEEARPSRPPESPHWKPNSKRPARSCPTWSEAVKRSRSGTLTATSAIRHRASPFQLRSAVWVKAKSCPRSRPTSSSSPPHRTRTGPRGYRRLGAGSVGQ